MYTRHLNLLDERRAGILLHPTSLPTGELDDEVFKWIDILSDAGVSVWQVLPLGVPQSGRSPYQSDSAFALNPALMSQYPSEDVNNDKFQLWLKEQSYWVEDFALFTVLKQHFHQQAWFSWPEEYRLRNADALARFAKSNRTSLNTILWRQYCLNTRWQDIHRYAREKGVFLFGDMPIFVAHDSADVWSRPENFLLDENGQATVVAGVPPDYFSETGQRWGNPHYNWQYLREHQFAWWLQRLNAHFDWFDIVRIDHFRGFEAVWEIDPQCDTAIEGRWQKVPGDELLQAFSEQEGAPALVAEDLGIITPEVTELRKKHKLPGMAVLQFSFDAFDDNPHKPKNMVPRTVAYTGTHDNDTTLGWFRSLDEDTKAHVLNQTGASGEHDIVDTMISIVLHSQANLAVIPLQDLLGLGSEARMNTPGTVENNWDWQYASNQLSTDLISRLKQQLIDCGRVK